MEKDKIIAVVKAMKKAREERMLTEGKYSETSRWYIEMNMCQIFINLLESEDVLNELSEIYRIGENEK